MAVILAGQPYYIGYSDDHGATWIEMDLPVTQELDGSKQGLNPSENDGRVPGSQGFVHFSIEADPLDANIVYVGGDSQPDNDFAIPQFPNSLGATGFTGRLFRGDTSIDPVDPSSTTNLYSPQWAHLTNVQDQGFVGGGTANDTGPHADSRDMAFLADGTLVEVDDGGIYRRTSPRDNTGDWFSLIGDLAVTEMHDVAYDSVSNTLIGGAQDNGTSQQLAPGSQTWTGVFGGDGGDVLVDDQSLAAQGQSIHYVSAQNLQGFNRETYDANGNPVAGSQTFIDTSAVIDPQFLTPIALNNVNPTRLIIGGFDTVYEYNQALGTPITPISVGIGVNSFNFSTGTKAEPIAYGNALNPDILYVGFNNEVYVRKSAAGSLLPTNFIGGYVDDIVIDPRTPSTAYVVDETGVYVTSDSGGSWTEITGNLSSIAKDGGFTSVTFISQGTTQLLIVGGRDGVFAMKANQPNYWVEVGTDLPNAVVGDLEYDQTDDVLVASTFGRGTFLINNASVTLATGSGFTYTLTDPGRPTAAGDWGGIVFDGASSGNLDYTDVKYGGGVTQIKGGTATYNPIEIEQAAVRISNSTFMFNASGVDSNLTSNPNRNGLGANSEATIFIRGAQPTIVTNIFKANDGNVISVDVNSLNSETNPDLGRATGPIFSNPLFGGGAANLTTEYANNVGPLVRNNRMVDNTTNGMEVRGGMLTTEGVWDDVDIVHVVRDEITIPDLRTFGGLRLQSNSRESLVVKLDGTQRRLPSRGSRRSQPERPRHRTARQADRWLGHHRPHRRHAANRGNRRTPRRADFD